MHIAFLNPQGNFDPRDSYWTQHPDFGGQLVYVKEVALAMAARGHRVDILTRRIEDPDWPEFGAFMDGYPGVENVRIVRIRCGPLHFLPKERLWPHLGTGWLSNIMDFYRGEGNLPDAFTAHYADGGLVGALLAKEMGVPFTFTGHSLGAQKMLKLQVTPENLAEMEARFHFTHRIFAERVSMNHAGRIITSTRQERMEQYAHPAYRGAVDPNDDQRFSVLAPGVNRRLFSPDPTPKDSPVQTRIQAALGRDIAEGRRELPLVVCSSRLDPKKNHVGLLQAFSQSPPLQMRANLGIVVRGLKDPLRDYDALRPGERQIMDEIVGILNTHDLWGKVTAFPLNSQAELAAAYRYLTARWSVFALVALYEPFGLAPLEAMSCGLPVVVTRNGGPSESLREGEREFGVLVDPGDPADVARGLLRVLASSDAWDQFHRVGMERILARYTWGRTAEGYLDVIQDLIQSTVSNGGLPIPAYFADPSPENDISLEELAALYFA
jgi:sucrose-phosphate synthase